MSEKKIEIQKVKARNRENNRLIDLARMNLGINDANITNYQQRIVQLKKEHKLRLEDMNKRLNRAIKNAEEQHALIDTLIAEKEKIHKDLKKAIHYGEVQCEYCKFYFKNEDSLSRHQKSCASRPDIKAVKEHKEEIDTLKEELDIAKQVKNVVNDKIEELQPGKVQCPECKDWFAKGGAFARHYQSHFPNGNGTE